MHQQLARERGDRGFAIGAGNGQHFGRIAVLLGQGGQGFGKQIQLAAHRQTDGAGSIDHGRNLLRGQPRRAVHAGHVLPGHQLGAERPGDKTHAGQLGLQQRQLRRRTARIGHRHLRPGAGAPAGHGQPRRAQAQHQHALAAQVLGGILRPAGRHRGPLHGGQRQVGLRVGRVSGRSGLIVLKNLRDKGRRVAGGGQRFVFRSCTRLFFNAFRHIYL